MPMHAVVAPLYRFTVVAVFTSNLVPFCRLQRLKVLPAPRALSPLMFMCAGVLFAFLSFLFAVIALSTVWFTGNIYMAACLGLKLPRNPCRLMCRRCVLSLCMCTSDESVPSFVSVALIKCTVARIPPPHRILISSMDITTSHRRAPCQTQRMSCNLF